VADRTRHRLRALGGAVGVDPAVLAVLADHPIRGPERLTTGIADLSHDLNDAKGLSLAEPSRRSHLAALEALVFPPRPLASFHS
jgi:hypothetical protein